MTELFGEIFERNQESWAMVWSTWLRDTTVTALPETEGDGFYALFAIEDVTELTRRKQYDWVMSEKLKQVNTELESFSYPSSQDLRAPLSESPFRCKAWVKSAPGAG